MKKGLRRLNICIVLAIILGLLVTLSARPVARPVSASAGNGVIAYVLPNDNTGDEIHLINGDGTDDQKIWSTGKPGVILTREVHSLTWKPDSSELAFMSHFQEACSVYQEDVYAIKSNGKGLRRQTAPYGCGPNPGLPTGTVVLNVTSSNETGVFIVYVEGAPAPQSIPMGAYQTKTLTFTNVMDYGDGVAQWAVGIVGLYRYMHYTNHVDVIPGQTAYGTLSLFKLDSPLSFKSPTYSGDGKYMAYISTPWFAYYGPTPMTAPGGIGWYWQPDNKDMTDSPSHLQWMGDTPDQSWLLYKGYQIFHTDGYGYGFYRADHTGSSLITEVADPVFGMAKLPDNSGLIYSSAKDMGDWENTGCVVQWVGNIYEYNFANHTTTQLSRYSPRPSTGTETCPPGPIPYELTISPDGSKIAFELQEKGSWTDVTYNLDLWIMNRDGSGARELVAGGLSPAWSPVDPPVWRNLYLPTVKR